MLYGVSRQQAFFQKKTRFLADALQVVGMGRSVHDHLVDEEWNEWDPAVVSHLEQHLSEPLSCLKRLKAELEKPVWDKYDR